MYSKFFNTTDFIISNINHDINNVSPLSQQVLASSICVLAFATYENSIKSIFKNFCSSKSPEFGDFFASKYEKINGKIGRDILKNEFIKHFGKKYVDNFDSLVNSEHELHLDKNIGSVKNSYDNLILWRHDIAHAAILIRNATYFDVIKAYNLGKIVIDCLYVALFSD